MTIKLKRISPNIKRLAILCLGNRRLKTSELNEIVEHSDEIYHLLNWASDLPQFRARLEIIRRERLHELGKLPTKKLQEMLEVEVSRSMAYREQRGYDDTGDGDENEHDDSEEMLLIDQILFRRFGGR